MGSVGDVPERNSDRDPVSDTTPGWVLRVLALMLLWVGGRKLTLKKFCVKKIKTE